MSRLLLRPCSIRYILAAVVLASSAAAQSGWPKLNYAVEPNWPRLPAGWTFEETPGVAVDAREHVFVFHRGPHSIMEFDKEGTFIRSWGDGVFVRPHGLKFDAEGNLWAADDQGHIVVKMDAQGRVRMVLGRKNNKGETNDLFNRPTDIAFAPNGDFYVSDGYGNSRVVKFTREGKFVTAWGKKGSAEGEFNLPHAVAVDRQGRVYVGDRENHRMQIFDANGKFLTQWKHVGSPWGIVITPDNFLFMCDGHNNRILKLNLSGEVLGTLSGPGKLPGQLDFSHHMAVGPSGSIYVAEIKNWRAQKFVPQSK
jgi:DNA-binding beta-propeller fold protein YncE